jgi:hypothetical protein
LFDHEDFQCEPAPRPNLAAPPPVESPHSIGVAEAFVEIVTDVSHYKRPPPISSISGLL